jgi:hypothetical protein
MLSNKQPSAHVMYYAIPPCRSHPFCYFKTFFFSLDPCVHADGSKQGVRAQIL